MELSVYTNSSFVVYLVLKPSVVGADLELAYVSEAGFEFNIQLRLPLNSQFYHIHFTSAGITGVCHHIRPNYTF